MQRGAVAHQSKEFLVRNGLYKKQKAKATVKKNGKEAVSEENHQ